jgi:hypothetical protein
MKPTTLLPTFLVAVLLAGCTASKPETNQNAVREFNERATALTQQNPDREGPPGYRTSYVKQLDDPNYMQLARPGMGVEDDPFRQFTRPEEWRNLDAHLRKLFVAQAQHPLIAVSEQTLSAKFLDKYLLKQPATLETVTVAQYYTRLLLKHQMPEWNVLLDVAEYVRPFVPRAQVREITDAVRVGAPADIAKWQADKQKYASETNLDPSATNGYLIAVSDASIRAGQYALERLETMK